MARQEPELIPIPVPAREIPPPSTISEAAQQALSNGAVTPRAPWPRAHDKDAWRSFLSATDPVRQAAFAKVLENALATVETVEIAGVACHDCRPHEVDSPGKVFMFVHGGAFVAGGGLFAKALGARWAQTLGARCVSVDYRMPPDHPFPAAPEDCLAVYRALLGEMEPGGIVIGGSSAGGNIAAATILMARDRAIPLPAGAVLLTPEADLTEAGDSFRTNQDLDVVLKRGLPECNALYADGRDLKDPYISPLFASFEAGFPPTLIQSGTRDLFLSNSVLLHRRLRNAGIDAELHVWEAMPHGGFAPGDVPENAEVQAEVARFFARVTG